MLDTPNDWQRLETLFAQAIDLPAGERAAFARRACADDRALGERLLELLAAHERTAGFLEASPALPAETLGEGDAIGPYRLVRPVGRGGMGTVYLAERADLGRPVALKVVRRGMDTDDVLRRFWHERQILAALDHSGIARLYDAGATDDGRPYFAMEYVDGEPIDAYCDRHRLSVAARLELFGKVCAAVQHAHQRLIVHRDLKPSNVLVTRDADGRPTPKLLDFGIAKVLDAGALGGVTAARTRTQAPLLTPAYAAPEQVRGERPTTATDVYALGVLLYELLTGARPLDLPGRAEQAARQAILQDDPTRPSTLVGTGAQPDEAALHARAATRQQLARTLRGDLDQIVLKALRKEPDARYASASALEGDLERYLLGEPVEARGRAWRYRAGRWARRYRSAVATAALFVLALSAGLGAALWQADVARAERDRAQVEAAKQSEMRRFVVSLFDVANPGSTDFDTVSVRAALDSGAVRIQTELAEQPLVQAELMATMGDIYRRLSDFEAASDLLEGALERTPPTGTPADTQRADALDLLGVLASDRGQYARADSLLRQALGLREAFYGSAHRRTMDSRRELAILLERRDRLDEALPLFEQVLAFHRAQTPVDTKHVGAAVSNLGYAYTQAGRLGEAEAMLREAIRLRTQLLGPDHPDVAFSYSNLGNLLNDLDRTDESLAAYAEALRIREAAYGPDNVITARARHGYGALLTNAGRHDEAARELTRALDVRRRALGEHRDTAETLMWLAVAHDRAGRQGDALRSIDQAVAVAERAVGPDHSTTRRVRERRAAIRDGA